jgi:predicted metal-dependent peptidase
MELLEIKETDTVPHAATDSKYIYINTEWFKSMTVHERAFVIAHEVLHCIYQHMERGKSYQDRGIGPDFKPYSHSKMNRAADYVINGTLAESKIGTMPVGGLHHPNIGSADNADDVYCTLPDEPDDPNNGPGSGTGGDGGFDKHMAPDPSAQRSNAEVQRAVTSAANAAKAQGNLPGALARLVGEIVDPQQDWREVLRDFMVTSMGHDEPSWRRLNRRRLVSPPHVAFPGTQGLRSGNVAIIIDTSGSISDGELNTFMSEVNGILEDAVPEQCKVFWTDSEVAGIDEVDEDTDLTTLEPKGGGGTDMPAAFPVIEQEFDGVDCCVCLTDGYTGWGEQPHWPMLWAITTKGKDAPYGTSLHLSVNN